MRGSRGMRARAALVALLTSVALVACSDGGDEPVTVDAPDPASPAAPPDDVGDEPEPSALPPVLSAGPDGVQVLADGEVTTFVDEAVDVAHDVGDGRVATDVGARIRVVSPDGRQLDVRVPGGERADEVDLLDAFVSAGRPLVVVATVAFPDDEEPSGDLLLINLESGLSTRLGDSLAPEYGVGWADHGGGLVAVTAFADLTESVSFVSESGDPVLDARSPTDDLPYNAPPLVIAAALSPDGERLAWLEGPDFDGASDRTVGEGWDLVVAERETLDEVARIGVAGPDQTLVGLDFDGRWAVVTVEDGPGLAVDVEGAGDVVTLDLRGQLSFVESDLT